MLHPTALEWTLGIIASVLIGISKTGVSGLGVLSVVLFALAFPSKVSVGIVLPVLICADVVAITSYRRHAVWSHLFRLFPWTAVGVVLGYIAMGRINDHQVAHFIGVISIALVAMQLWRRQVVATNPEKADAVPHKWWFAAAMGILAGFTTMVANAAGPIMILYLLAAGLPKLEFMGTGAWFFFIVNCFKVPFQASLGGVSAHTLSLDLVLGPAAIIGAFIGRAILPKIKQVVFENLALTLTVAAGIKLLLQ